MSPLIIQGAPSRSLCEWKIKTDAKFRHNLLVSRDPGNYEDLYVEIKKADKIEIYTSKHFSDCSSTLFELDFKGATFVVIRANIMDDKSRYALTLSKTTNLIDIPLYIMILVPILLGLIVITTVFAITYF